MALPGSMPTGKHAKVEQAYQKALCNQLWGLQRTGILCDVTLQIEGELIGVHGAVLSSSSTYLKDLCVQLRAMPNPSSRVIQIHHSTVSVCLKMIEYLYTGRSSQFTAEERQDFTDLCLSWMVPNPTDYEAQSAPSPAKKAKTTKNTQSPTKTWTDLAPLDELEDSIMMETGENNDYYAEANEAPEMDDSDNDADEGRREDRSELLVEDKQEKCDICHIIFYNRNLLVAHNVEFHYQDGMELPQEYVCTVPGCEYKTFYSKAMAAHEDYHYKMGVPVAAAEEPVWKCTECGRRCSNEASLKVHQETHQRNVEAETVTCDLCSKVFSTRALLKGHIKRVHDPRDRLVCPQCGYQTLKSDIMKEHMFQKHDILPASGKLIQCEHCDHQSTGGRFSATHSLRHNSSSHISQYAIREMDEWIASILFERSGPLMTCPMCPELKFKPTQPRRLESHLESSHDKHAVRLGDMKMVPCYNICHNGMTVAHYHCPCGRVIRQRKRMCYHIKHGRGHELYRKAKKRVISKDGKERAISELRKKRAISAPKKERAIGAPKKKPVISEPKKKLVSSVPKGKPMITIPAKQTVMSVPVETVTEEVVVTQQQLQWPANADPFHLQNVLYYDIS